MAKKGKATRVGGLKFVVEGAVFGPLQQSLGFRRDQSGRANRPEHRDHSNLAQDGHQVVREVIAAEGNLNTELIDNQQVAVT